MSRHAFVAIVFWVLSAPIALQGADSANLLFSMSALFLGPIAYWLVFDRDFLHLARTNARRVLHRAFWPMLLFCGGLVAYYFCWYYSIYSYAPSQALIINYMWPLVLYLVQMLIFRDASNRPTFDPLILLLAFIGAFFLAFEPQGAAADGLSFQYLPYQFAFVAALLPAVYMSSARVVIERSEITSTQAYQLICLLAAPLLLIASGLSLAFDAPMAALGELWPPALMGITSVAIAHTAFNRAMDGTNNAFLSSAAFLTPILTLLILATFFDGELSPQAIFGISLILVANVLTSRLLDNYITATASVLGVLYVLAGASFKIYVGTAPLDSGVLQSVLAIFTLVAGFMLSQISPQRKTQLEDLEKLAAITARLSMRLSNDPKSAAHLATELSGIFAAICAPGASTEAGQSAAMLRISRLTEWLSSTRENRGLQDLAPQFFDACLSVASHQRNYYSSFELLLLSVLGISVSTMAVASIETDGFALTGTALLACGLAYLLGKLFELNNFFGTTIAQQETHFNRVAFPDRHRHLLFKDRLRPDFSPKPAADLIFDGAVLPDNRIDALKRKRWYDTAGRTIVVALLLLALLVQVLTISLG